MNNKAVHKWITHDRTTIDQWFNKLDKEKKIKENKVITDFRRMIVKNPIERMYLTEMIEQIPKGKKYDTSRLKNIDHMLCLLNVVLTKAPEYNETLLVGTPFSAVLIWTMGTPAGFCAYRNEKINNMLKKLLKEWCKFLNSKKSLYVLNDGPNGWMSKHAMKKLHMENYQYKPNEKYWGFKSWNDFFTRKLAKGVRPITAPNNDKIIVSACDSTIYKIGKNIQLFSKFWIKNQPYSLMDMLDNNEKYATKFKGGIVYQAFLNPFNYHRWHSPISGTIEKVYIKEGLYFSQVEAIGENETDQNKSEGYLTEVQTRAIIIIKADNKKIGHVCVMPIGMVEISSCMINKKIKVGYHVKKGDELGYFQFGGSTHCLIFEPGVIKKFARTRGFVKVGEKLAETY